MSVPGTTASEQPSRPASGRRVRRVVGVLMVTVAVLVGASNVTPATASAANSAGPLDGQVEECRTLSVQAHQLDRSIDQYAGMPRLVITMGWRTQIVTVLRSYRVKSCNGYLPNNIASMAYLMAKYGV